MVVMVVVAGSKLTLDCCYGEAGLLERMRAAGPLLLAGSDSRSHVLLCPSSSQRDSSFFSVRSPRLNQG